ncbi:hypothetical protein [Pseudalkalibacillus caeni]|uniref:Lipoprotein n=1 Tax=Exobacillus caeni TaxID=2574798 RepID=A0A5R9F784_9BACL|nr:hypothetical protein [Pseudalkalibacillus caeni]TLS38196.1 hypothetical protein FCL54_06570 [Pseudalkalibacillus caeni]
MGRPLFILICLLILGGCALDQGNTDSDPERMPATFQEALLEARINKENVIYEHRDKNAGYVLYKKDEEIGISHFRNTDQGWSSTGSSSGSVTDDKPLSFIGSTWLLGQNAPEANGTYQTVFYGEVLDHDIGKVNVSFGEALEEAQILTHRQKRYWLISKKGDASKNKVIVEAYSNSGKKIFISESDDNSSSD